MTTDILARISAFIAEEQAPYAVHRNHLPTEAINLLLDAQHEIHALLRWKDEATQALSQYDAAWMVAGSPGRLGELKAQSLTREILSMRSKLNAIKALFAEDRATYYGHDDEGYTRWSTFQNLADEVAGLLR